MNHLEVHIDFLKERILTMASHAKRSVKDSMKALVERNDPTALKVKQNDEIIDHLEKEVDEIAVVLLSKAPLARDLRMILVALKLAHNLERIGDEATTISRRAQELNQFPPSPIAPEIPEMAELAVDMLNKAMDAYINAVPESAREIIPRDAKVDELNRSIRNTMTDRMMENPATVKGCLNWITISKSLERIADHAANIAEEVVFLYEARDIRHTGMKNIEPGAA